MIVRATRVLLALGLGFAVTGCGRIQEAAMPVDEKVSAAFPVSDDVRTAQRRLVELLASNEVATEALASETATRLTVRALDCTKGLSIGRLDSVASVRSLAVDQDCLDEHDQSLLQFYTLRAIGELMGQRPLRPRKTLGPISKLPPGRLKYIIYGTIARDANVAALRDSTNSGAVVEIPSGREISKLPRAAVSEPNNYMSPNGRLIVVSPLGDSTTFYDAESGDRVWESSEDMQILAWLPSLSGFLYRTRDGNVMIADGRTGTVSDHPIAVRNSNYGASIPGGHERVLIGTGSDLSLVEHRRTPRGIEATELGQFHIKAQDHMMSGQPVPMRSGRAVVFKSSRGVAWLDLEDGKSGAWDTNVLSTLNFGKLDESHLLISTVGLDRLTTRFWSFDIDAETIAPVEFGVAPGLIVDTRDRKGFMLRGNDAWIGDRVTAGEPIALSQLTRNFDLEVAAAMTDASSPNDAVADAERALAYAYAPAPQSPSAPTAHRAMMPGLSDIPQDAEVHIVGVYQGPEGSLKDGPNSRPRGSVRVQVKQTNHPIVLVLSSYDAVNWVVIDSGNEVAAVLLSGYDPSTVMGVGNTRVLRIGRTYAYNAGSEEYQSLRRVVSMYTGERRVASFQGAYTGKEFTVGGQ